MEKENLLRDKLIYTVLILLVYSIGKCLPLYGIDMTAYTQGYIKGESLLIQTISGDIHQCSIFALGIAPYMIATMIVQIVTILLKKDDKVRISPIKSNRVALLITVLLSVLMAWFRLDKLHFTETVELLALVKLVAVLEMVTGAVIIIWLSVRNKKYGIGGQTALIYVNILEGIIATISKHPINHLLIPLAVSLVVMLVMIVMEEAEFRIPVQRISIHNIYADKNYMAIKLNPIGVMPIMFSTAMFMLPVLLVNALLLVIPNNQKLLWLSENLNLSKPFGIFVLLGIIYLLTIGFSRLFMNPKDITEQFLKSGDSIVNIRAGKETKRYLSGVIGWLSFFSATVMSICVVCPLLAQTVGNINNSLVMLPTSVMMLTGIWCNLYREVKAIRSLEAYKPFL